MIGLIKTLVSLDLNLVIVGYKLRALPNLLSALVKLIGEDTLLSSRENSAGWAVDTKLLI